MNGLSTWQRGLSRRSGPSCSIRRALEDHLTGVEERLRQLEARLVAISRARRHRGAGIHARLETVKRRVVEDLKH